MTNGDISKYSPTIVNVILLSLIIAFGGYGVSQMNARITELRTDMNERIGGLQDNVTRLDERIRKLESKLTSQINERLLILERYLITTTRRPETKENDGD